MVIILNISQKIGAFFQHMGGRSIMPARMHRGRNAKAFRLGLTQAQRGKDADAPIP